MKQCSKCNEKKDDSFFKAYRGRICRSCYNEHQKKVYCENPERFRKKRQRAKERERKGNISCKKCGVLKDVSDFYPNRLICKKCYIPTTNKNKKKRNAYLKKYRRKKIKEKPELKLNINISRAIRRSLKSSKGNRSWEDLVGYTLQDLKNHLESQFEPWMTWENYGNPNGDHSGCWHMDHVIPVSWFKFSSYEDPQFKECWALPNLQPKNGKENISKLNRFIG